MDQAELSPDPVVERVVERLRSRSVVGTRKYGVTLDRSRARTPEFLQHLLEELLDAANYVQKLIDLHDQAPASKKGYPPGW
jgi:hypothetical protein